jgi:hypothetical protein
MKPFFILSILSLFCFLASGQKAKNVATDSSSVNVKPTKVDFILDTAALRKYKPGIAIKRSAMIPGWGQYTNKKYWKIPLVYAGVGIPTYLFFRNIKQYKDAKNALALATDGDPNNDTQIKEPYFSARSRPDVIKNFRNQVRQNADYSILFFILFWGLNVADAAVDAHLKTFNVNDDLSIYIKPGYSPLANTNGLSVVFALGKTVPKKLVFVK